MRKFFLFAFLLLCTYLPVYAELLPVDAVLVLDVSRSMRTADPARVSRDAMALFIEMLEAGRDRVGVVAYAGAVERVFELADIHERESLSGFIASLDYASWTDHGLGLLEAVGMLAPDDGRQGVIVFLTDGNLNVNPAGVRTKADAQADVYTAIARAAELSAPIHTIGLNFDGNLQCIAYIAEATGGLTFETAYAGDIPEIIAAFFGEMITAPQFPEPAEPPEPEPSPEPEPPEASKSTYVTEPEPPTDKIFVIAIAATVLLTGALILAKCTRRRRVFTGRLVLETSARRVEVNLIEHGRRVTLGTLLEDAEYDAVILTPSATAPSHLPQLEIHCKNPAVTFTKNFTPQEIKHGISLSPGTEAEISTADAAVRLKYLA